MNRRAWLSLRFMLAFFALPFYSHAADSLSVGVVPQFDARHITRIWQPILEEISRLSGIALELKTSSSIPEFEQQFASGTYDFAYMNPYHAVLAHQKQGYEPVVRDTGRSLHGIIVVRKDSALTSVKQLDGQTVAFPAPNALGASLIPRAEFASKFDINIKEIYVKSHSSVYLNVLLGKAAAGGGVQKTLSQQPEEIREQLQVLYKTKGVAPHPLSVHERVDQNTVDRVTEAFLELGSTDTGKNLLKQIPIKSIGAASMEDYKSLRKMGLEAFYVTK
jgi:phosphonate transport system substrate-binding protein